MLLAGAMSMPRDNPATVGITRPRVVSVLGGVDTVVEVRVPGTLTIEEQRGILQGGVSSGGSIHPITEGVQWLVSTVLRHCGSS